MKIKKIKKTKINKDIIFYGKVVFENDAFVIGSIYAEGIEAKKNLFVTGKIDAGNGNIKAGGDIITTESIYANGYIKVRGEHLNRREH